MPVRMRVAMLSGLAGILAGCTVNSGDAMQRSAHDEHRHDAAPPAQAASAAAPGVVHYQPVASDPDWLRRAAGFHGHLGPWLTLGGLVGTDALRRLDTRGYWDVEVTVFMTPARQRQPFSCVLDGLQATTGATLGKQNIRFADDPAVLAGRQVVVHVIRRGPDGAATAGLSYAASPALDALLAKMSPTVLESLSREIAEHDADALFDVRSLSADELRTEGGR